MSPLVWAGVLLLGGTGAMARFVVDAAISDRVNTSFPVGTFAINITGAFILGLLVGLAVTGDAIMLVGGALLGSFTTFSTWMFESHRLTENAEPSRALLNLILSLVLGVTAAAIGHAIGAQL